MREIRRFQEQRQAWESEREELAGRLRQQEASRAEADRLLEELRAELAQLRAAPAPAPAPAEAVATLGRPEEVAELVRQHHEKQLGLMATVDSLRSDLRRERARADALEGQRGTGERCPSAARAGQADRNGGVPGEQPCVQRKPSDPEVTGACGEALLESTRRSLERKREELRALEDESLRLREELNAEKHKVVVLKKAAHSRAAAWKEQLDQLTAEMASHHAAEEERAQLRLELTTLRSELKLKSEREVSAQRELRQLRCPAQGSRTGQGNPEEMQHSEMQKLSRVMSGQLVAMEQELTQQAQKNAQLMELFLKHALQPLGALRRACTRLAKEADIGAPAAEAPPMFEANAHDLKCNLVKIVNLLRYAAGILERQGAPQPQPAPDPAFGAAPASPKEEEQMLEMEQTRSWFGGIFT